MIYFRLFSVLLVLIDLVLVIISFGIEAKDESDVCIFCSKVESRLFKLHHSNFQLY